MAASIPFRAFNERRDIRIYHGGDLPHCRQNGCTYFVTFRLADALPQIVVRELEAVRSRWLRSHDIDPLSHEWKQKFALLPLDKKREYERNVAANLNDRLDEYTARKCNQALIRQGTFWHSESYDPIIRDLQQLERFQRSIRANPSKANLRAGDYHLSEEATYDV